MLSWQGQELIKAHWMIGGVLDHTSLVMHFAMIDRCSLRSLERRVLLLQVSVDRELSKRIENCNRHAIFCSLDLGIVPLFKGLKWQIGTKAVDVTILGNLTKIMFELDLN